MYTGKYLSLERSGIIGKSRDYNDYCCLCSSHILMHAISYEECMVGFWNFIYGFFMKNGWPVVFLSELSPFHELCCFDKTRMNSCQQDISQSIWPRNLKLGQLIEDDAWIAGLTCEQSPSIFFGATTLWKFGHFKLVCNIWARSLDLSQLIGDDKRKTWLNFEKKKIL